MLSSRWSHSEPGGSMKGVWTVLPGPKPRLSCTNIPFAHHGLSSRVRGCPGLLLALGGLAGGLASCRAEPGWASQGRVSGVDGVFAANLKDQPPACLSLKSPRGELGTD